MTEIPGSLEHLTEREMEVLKLCVRGYSAKAIARSLGVARSTVHTHLLHIYAKLGVKTRGRAVYRAQKMGLA